MTGIPRGRVLVVAGSDSGGGAGLQADIKTITALGGYAATAVTGLTVQDTRGVKDMLSVPPAFVAAQIRAVLDDIGADVVKTGMLGDARAIAAIAEALQGGPGRPKIVVDPVMVAKGGACLLASDALPAFKRLILPLAFVITPNLPEAEALCGTRITSLAEMHHAANAMLTLGVPAVLLTGGHLPGREVVDVLATEEGSETLSAERIETRHTHGTGCTLASAIAAGLAQQMPLRDAVLRARAFVRAAIRAAPGFGAGHGPLGHSVTVDTERLADPALGGSEGPE